MHLSISDFLFFNPICCCNLMVILFSFFSFSDWPERVISVLGTTKHL